MGKTKINKTITDLVNDNTYLHYFSQLSLLAKTMFEWVNLPDSINERYLEYCLFNYGRAVFFEDDKLGILCLKADPTNYYNIYREPIGIEAVGENGYHKKLKDGQFVLIRNNEEEIPTRYSIESFAYRLYDAQRTADTNVFLHKIPYMVFCEDKELFSIKQLFEKIQSNEPVVYGVKGGTLLENIKVVETKVPFILNDMMDYKNVIWSEAMTFLGIKNANTDKRERLITSEVNANDEQIGLSAEIMLKTRKRACEEFNKMFPGYNIDVKLRETEYINVNLIEGGENDVFDGELHSNTETTD